MKINENLSKNAIQKEKLQHFKGGNTNKAVVQCPQCGGINWILHENDNGQAYKICADCGYIEPL